MKTMASAALICAVCHAQAVRIVNSGSTNTAGFQIVIEKSGVAEYTQQGRRHAIDQGEVPKTIRKTVPQPLVKALYEDVKAAHPLSSLPPQSCMKSVSFGTRLTVQFGDDTSPDLSCGGGNAKVQALKRDADTIVKIFNEP